MRAMRSRIAALIHFEDPEGNRLGAFHGAQRTAGPFVPGRPISGFPMGPHGMGRAVLQVRDAAALPPFYRDLLGFGVSDCALAPYPLYVLHVNGRHHSFAIVGSGQQGFHHFMVELGMLGDVGQGYDLAQLEPGRVAFALRRHTNDHMPLFHAHSSSGFFVEYGWGARVIEPASRQPHETFDGPSLWGHERLYLPEGPRAAMREMRLNAAAKGLRAPIQGLDCPWLEGVAGPSPLPPVAGGTRAGP